MTKDIMISQFVDDELSLDEKLAFVESVHADALYKEQTVDILHLERELRMAPVDHLPDVEILPRRRPSHVLHFSKQVWVAGTAVAAVAAAIILFFTLSQEAVPKTPHRFVLFQPQAERVEISGSFTGWQAVPMQKAGLSGYWETTIDLPQGEHRFSYIIGGRQRVPDPTILVREQDDFGGVNSIIEVDSLI
ncbi:MAG: glycogen-binding domain-containing protein [Deltaproteobacteria bacterium]|nr:glycogen-binding domain-containing protein [Deltaproteobacteria bacterium]